MRPLSAHSPFASRSLLSRRCARLIAVVVFCLSLRQAMQAQDNPARKRPPAPAWQLVDLDRKTVKLSDFKGKVVILDFWATWCPPCRQEIPGFIELQKKYAAKGLVVIGVALDEDGAAVVRPFAKRLGMNYPVVMGDNQIVMAYGGIEVVPTTYIIDRQGRVVTGHQGYAEPAAFEADILPLLQAQTP